MLKKLLYGFAVAAAFTACTDDDYTDWANPQANGEDAIETVALNVTSVDPIQLAEVATEKVKIFIAELTPEEKKAAKYEVIFAPTDESQQVKVGADAEGNVAVSDLISAITSFYGKRPVERTLVTTVNAYVLQDGVAVRKQGTINVLATPPGVVIENAYYLIGDCNGWSRDKVAEYKFNHSDADVYDDPVFTITVPAPVDETSGERKDFYFNIVPESSMALEDGGFWPSLIGSDLENGDDRTEAGLSVKIDGQDNAFMQHAEDGAKFYTITLNMLDGIMTINGVAYEEYIYIPGNHQGWSPESAPTLYCEGGTGVYSGFSFLDGGFKFTKGPAWADGEYNWGSFTTHPEGFTGEGGGDITCTVPDFYYITANIPEAKLEAVPVAMGIIGPAQAGGWDNDTDMTYNREEGCWEVTIELAADEFKFRANDGWDINVGGSLDNLTPGGDNIRNATAGTYTVKLYLNRQNGEKKMYATLLPA